MTNGNTGKRENRVKLLKKLLISFLILGIVLPLLLCTLLFIKVAKLESELKRLEQSAANDNEQAQAAASADSQDSFVEVFHQEDVKRYEQLLLKDETDKDGKTKVYLTFDDGPSYQTEKVLDILEQYNIKATFFVIAKPETKYEHIYQRIIEEGHTLGMHSYSHKYNEIYASEEAFWQDFNQLQEFLYDVTEVWPRFYRFPGGSSNHVSKLNMMQLTKEMMEQDIYYLDWNVSGDDSIGLNLSAQQIADNVTESALRYETAVVLLHDAGDKSATVEALPLIIEKLQKEGQVVFLPVDENMNFVQHLSITKE